MSIIKTWMPLDDAIRSKAILRNSTLGNIVPFSEADFKAFGLASQNAYRPAFRIELFYPSTNQVYGYLFASDSELNEIQMICICNEDKDIDTIAAPWKTSVFTGLVLDTVVQFAGFPDITP